LAVLLVVASLVLPASAVVVRPGATAALTETPGDDPGFAHVGTVGGLSAVYVGHGWVLTAAHVVSTDSPILVLGDETYRAVPDSMVQLETRPGVTADLELFRLVEEPALTPLAIASEEPKPNETVTLVGNGWTPADDETHWSADWREVDPARAVYVGFRKREAGVLRWGRNAVTWVGRDVKLGRSVTRSFETRFDRTGGPEEESTAVTGDSGGAVFAKRAGRWELAGILYARNAHEGQPSGTVAYGNITQIADLSFYREQILDLTRGSEGLRLGVLAVALVTSGLLLAASVGWWLRRRRLPASS
jgi:hypothetical protein